MYFLFYLRLACCYFNDLDTIPESAHDLENRHDSKEEGCLPNQSSQAAGETYFEGS